MCDFLSCIENSKIEINDTLWSTLLYRNYDDYNLTNMHYDILKEQVRQMYENISVPSDSVTEIVESQGSLEWYAGRQVRVTASIAEAFSSVKNPRSSI